MTSSEIVIVTLSALNLLVTAALVVLVLLPAVRERRVRQPERDAQAEWASVDLTPRE